MHRQNLKFATLFTILSAIFIAASMTLIKKIDNIQSFNAFSFLAMRTIMGLPFLIPAIIKIVPKTYKQPYWHAYLIRTTLGFGATGLWMYSFLHIPLNTATAISFSVPIFSTILAALFLKEHVGWERTLAIVVGFVGVLVILRPAFLTYNKYYFLVVFVSIFWSINNIIMRRFSREIPPLQFVVYYSLIMSAFTLPFVIPVFKMMNLKLFILFSALGLVSNLGNYSMKSAFKYGEVSFVQTLDFTRLLFISIASFIFLGEVLDLWTILGSIIVLSSTSFISIKELSKHRKK